MTRTVYMILMSLFFITLTTAIHYYIWARLVRDAALPTPYRQIATGLVIFLGLSIPFTMFFGRTLPFAVASYVNYIPFVWMGTMMLFVFLFATADGLKLIGFIAGKIVGGHDGPADPTRRLAMGRVLAAGAGVVVGGMSSVAIAGGNRQPTVYNQEISLGKLTGGLDGFRIVQISDLHIGLTVGGKWLADIVERVGALKPDLIAITGDLVDGFVGKLESEVAPLAGLKAPQGVYFVTGNHEYYSGADDWIAFIKKMGIRVLRNERVKIGDDTEFFYLAGVDDHNAKGMAPGHGVDLDRALQGRDATKETVLLAHQPRTALDAAAMDVGLVLSGHTHGGQIWPFSYLVDLQQPYNKGLYRNKSGTQIYVNQGTGLWGPPMRLGTQSEITVLTLKRA